MASVAFDNKTVINVAKIEGGATYKSTLRQFSASFINNVESVDASERRNLPHSYGIGDWLPPWRPRRSPQEEALNGMLQALKSATESYLEDSMSAAMLSVPLAWTAEQRDILHTVASSLGIETPAFGVPAGKLAARARGLSGDCSQDPSKLVLSVDFSRTAFTGQLWDEECGDYKYTRQMYELTLGSNDFDEKCQDEGEDACLNILGTALRKLTALPLPDLDHDKSDKLISGLVLYGENASDRRLNQVVKEVLLEQYVPSYGTGVSQAADHFDPVFAAAQALALQFFSPESKGSLVKPAHHADDQVLHKDLR